MARDRSLTVTLKGNVSDYVASMKSAAGASREFNEKTQESIQQNRKQWTEIGTIATGAGLAIALGLGVAVAKFADFDQAMSGAAAATRATSSDLQALRDAAMKAGADTQYSATEAANAITELGKAGIETGDILAGGLTGALDLAAAGQMDVAQAAELAATAMTQFKLSGDKLPHVADLLAAGAGKAQGSVADMGMALKQSGLVAKQTGLSLEETTGTLAAFASAGLVGSDAGTSFKSMLQRLTPQSKEAQAAMDELGISAYDAQGNFVGLEKFAGNLRTSMQGLTVEQRNSAMATIFGADAVRAAAVLYDNGSEGVRKWIAAVDDAGFAQESAAKLTDNLRGDLERLGGAFDTALIQSGSVLNGTLRSLVQGVEGLVTGVSELPAPLQKAGVYLGVASAAILTLGGGALVSMAKLQAFKATLIETGVVSEATAGKLGQAAKSAGILAAAAVGLTAAYSGMQGVMNSWAGANDDAVRSLETLLASGAKSQGVTMAMRDGFDNLGAAVERTFNENAWIKATNVLDSVMFWDGSQAGSSIEFFRQMDAALSGFVASGRGEQAAKTFKQITDEAERQGIPIERLKAAFPQYAAALEGATSAQIAAKGEVQTTSQAVGEYIERMKGATEQTKAYADALKGISSPILDAREAARQWAESVEAAEAALRSNGKTLDESTVKGRENARALDDMVKKTVSQISAMQANGATQTELQGKLSESRARIEAMAVAFGMSTSQAQAYASQLLNIPANVTSKIAADTTLAYKDIVALASKLDTLRDRTIYIRTVTTAVNMDSSSTGYNKAQGGHIRGPGTSTSDSIPAMLSDGEYVIRTKAVDHYGLDFMHRINAMRFADGGFVSRSAPVASPATSLVGMAIEGTIDMGNGLWGHMRAVVRDEMTSVARDARVLVGGGR